MAAAEAWSDCGGSDLSAPGSLAAAGSAASTAAVAPRGKGDLGSQEAKAERTGDAHGPSVATARTAAARGELWLTADKAKLLRSELARLCRERGLPPVCLELVEAPSARAPAATPVRAKRAKPRQLDTPPSANRRSARLETRRSEAEAKADERSRAKRKAKAKPKGRAKAKAQARQEAKPKAKPDERRKAKEEAADDKGRRPRRRRRSEEPVRRGRAAAAADSDEDTESAAPRRPQKKRRGGQAPRTKTAAAEKEIGTRQQPEALNNEEKTTLQQNIDKLPDDQLEEVINFLRPHLPVSDEQDGDVDVDLDHLRPAKQRELVRYVDRLLAQNAAAAAAAGAVPSAAAAAAEAVPAAVAAQSPAFPSMDTPRVAPTTGQGGGQTPGVAPTPRQQQPARPPQPVQADPPAVPEPAGAAAAADAPAEPDSAATKPPPQEGVAEGPPAGAGGDNDSMLANSDEVLSVLAEDFGWM